MDFQAFGEELRKARTQKARSLDDLSSLLKIHRRHLEAIEAGDLSRLPQGPYVKAFVREYARALGLTVPEEFTAPEAGPERGHRDPKVVSRPVGGKPAGEEEGPSFISQLSALPMNAVKTVTKTTESMVNLVESSGKEALEVLTSKSLWDEAENVRRERHGLPPIVRVVEPPKIPKMEDTPSPSEAPETRLSSFLQNPSSVLQKTTSKKTTNVIIGLLALLFAGAAYFAIRMSSSGSASTTGDYVPAPVEKPRPIETKKAEKPSASQPTTVPPPAAISSKDSLRFTLRATQPVWISIAPDGVPAYRGELKAGDVRSFSAAQKIVVDLGNQKSVEMQLNGQRLSNLPAIQNSSVVVRDLVLMRDKVTLGGAPVDFKKLTTPPPTTQRSVAHAEPLPPIPFVVAQKKKASLNPSKNAASSNLPKKTATPIVPKASSQKLPAAVNNPATPNTSKKQSKKPPPPVPEIHTVDPIPPKL